MIDLICGACFGDPGRLTAARDRMVAGLSLFGAPRISLATWPGAAFATVRLGGADAPDCAAGALSAPPGIRLGAPGDRPGAEWPGEAEEEFAAAFWSARRGELTLVRDRLGIRPLFHARLPGGVLAFASLAEALVSAGADAAPDPDETAAIMGPVSAATPRTQLAGIRRVLPAHTVTFRGPAEVARRYWRLPGRAVHEDVPAEHLAADLRAQLDRAVARRLPPSGTVAAHLSGGLDSSSVAVLAQPMLASRGQPIVAWCRRVAAARMGTGAVDQWALASAAAAMGGIALRETRGDYLRACLEAPLQRACPDPIGPLDPDTICLAEAAEAGAGVLLSGLGGDEGASFRGSGALAEAAFALRWGALARHPARALRSELAAALPPGLANLIRRLAGRAPLPVHGLGAYLARGRSAPAPAAHWNSARLRRLMLESRQYATGLEMRAAKAARFGISCAYPLLDTGLLEFTQRLPARAFVEGGVRRSLMRRAMRGALPDALLDARTKMLDDPTEGLFLAEARPRLAGLARALAAVPAVTAVIDMAAVARAIDAIPPAAEVRAAIDAATREGRQHDSLVSDAWLPLLHARFLAGPDGPALASALPPD